MIKLMVDSGAYSAWTSDGSIPISLDDYIAFIKRNEHLLDCYVSLDVIAGTESTREWRPEQIEQAAAQGYANWARMKDAGLDPIPVFHQDEKFDWLDKYRADGVRYIALAPHDGAIHCGAWVDDCLTVLSDPAVKVHLLGITTHFILHQFPLTSADSGTWIWQAAAGHIPLPVWRNDKPDYALPHGTIALGRKLRANHFDLLDQFDQERARRYLEQQCGVTIEQARSDHVCRWRVWANFFNALASSAQNKIYFVNSFNARMRDTLIECGAEHHLLSYFYLREKPAEILRQYVTGGEMRHPRCRTLRRQQ